MGHVPLSQASCPPHLFIPLYLSVVALRICSLSSTSFLQLFCYCSEMYKGLFSSECRTWLGTPSSRLFSYMSPGACPGDSGSGDQRGGLGFLCQLCLHWFWPGSPVWWPLWLTVSHFPALNLAADQFLEPSSTTATKLIPSRTACMHVCMLCHVWLFVTPWTVACHDPLSMEFSRQEYWSEFAISFSRGSSWPRDRTWSLESSALAGWFFTTEPIGSPSYFGLTIVDSIQTGESHLCKVKVWGYIVFSTLDKRCIIKSKTFRGGRWSSAPNPREPSKFCWDKPIVYPSRACNPEFLMGESAVFVSSFQDTGF